MLPIVLLILMLILGVLACVGAVMIPWGAFPYYRRFSDMPANVRAKTWTGLGLSVSSMVIIMFLMEMLF